MLNVEGVKTVIDFQRANPDEWYKMFGRLRPIGEPVTYGFANWVLFGRRAGDFVMSVIRNDLMETFQFADMNSQQYLKVVILWIYNDVPGNCWRRQNIEEWEKVGGLVGETRARQEAEAK